MIIKHFSCIDKFELSVWRTQLNAFLKFDNGFTYFINSDRMPKRVNKGDVSPLSRKYFYLKLIFLNV